MFARMLVHENAGVAGYSEAFMYGQSGKQASIRSSYFRIDVLGFLLKKNPLKKGIHSFRNDIFFKKFFCELHLSSSTMSM